MIQIEWVLVARAPANNSTIIAQESINKETHTTAINIYLKLYFIKNILGTMVPDLLKSYPIYYGITGNCLATEEIKPQFCLVKILMLA